MAHNEFIKVQDILVELMSSLKMEYEVSASLYALYDYMQQGIEANMQRILILPLKLKGFPGAL